VVPSGLEDSTSPGTVRPRLTLYLGTGTLKLRDVPSNDLLSYSALRGVPKDRVDGLDHARGQAGVVALTALERATHRLLTGSIPSVPAALALGADSVDEEADVLGVELAQALLTQAGNEVEPDDALVPLVCLGAPLLADDVLQPVVQEVGQRPVLRGDGDALVGLAEKLGQLLPSVFLGACRTLTLHGSGGGLDEGGVPVAAILTGPDASLTVRALADAAAGPALRLFLSGARHGLGHCATSTRVLMQSARASAGTRRRRPILMVCSWERMRV